MDQKTVWEENEKARRRFSQDCLSIGNKIAKLQSQNDQLLARLEALIRKQHGIINRLHDLLAR